MVNVTALASRRAWLATSTVSVGLLLAAPLPSAIASDPCANAEVRAQQSSTRLPDCRAYELLNPATDDIGEVNRVPMISDDGDTVVYTSAVPPDSALGAGTSSLSVARRGARGWSSLSADPFSYGALWQHTGITEPIVFSADFTKGLVNTTLPGTPTDDDTVDDYFRVDVGRGTTTLMSPALISFPYSPLGATASLDRIVFDVTANVAEAGIYANEGGATNELLSVDENGAPLGGVVRAGTGADRGLDVGVGLGSHRPFVERGGSHGVSDDTMRVFFYTDTNAVTGLGFAGTLRLNDHDASRVVSASQRAGDIGTAYPARFISASHDGGTVYFTSLAQLTDSATPGGGIYRYDVATRALTQITPDAGPSGLDLNGAMVSDDQSHVYFVSSSDLAPGAAAGDRNAYVWTAAAGVRFIATVGGSDLFSRVTPDGRFALMLSSQSIGGAANNGFQAVYRYDDTTRQVVCVSCRPDGSPSGGTALIEGQGYGMPNAPLSHNRALTFDGGVVFTSTDRLTKDDQTIAQDVYMYHNGGVALLTAGTGDSDSYTGDVSDDGKNVIVVTRSALVRADRDPQEHDVYDVRVGGGYLEPPLPKDPCRGDDCQGPASPPPPAISGTRVKSSGMPPAKSTKKVDVSALTASQRSALARTGKTTIAVQVVGGGTVSIRGRGRVAGTTQTTGSGSETVLKRSQTTVKIPFRLTAKARRELSRKHRLRMTLQTRLSGVSKSVSSTVDLTAKSR
jgi:hypothetical protein